MPPLSSALLPAGLTDLLPPEASHEAKVVEGLMAHMAARGYERVKPPLVEFEESLLAGSGAGTASQTFRLLDPSSQRMMGIRADLTLQIARIASTRLSRAARPLRLAYAGDILRIKGSQLRPERQFTQVGAELIGSLRPEADAEVILAAVSALRGAGVPRLAVDLNVPTLVPALCAALEAPLGAELRQALDRKDITAVTHLGAAAAPLLARLVAMQGPAQPMLTELETIALPDKADPDRRRLIEVIKLLQSRMPDLALTIDLVEHRGFEFQSGMSFTLFGPGVRGELGRGGRYRVGGAIRAAAGDETRHGEPATGFTLYLDSLLRAIPAPACPSRLYLPHDTPEAVAESWRQQNWVTLAALEPVTDLPAAAMALGCSHWLEGSDPRPVNAEADSAAPAPFPAKT